MKKITVSSIFTILLGLSAFGQKQAPMKVKKEDFKDLKASTSMVFAGGDTDAIVKKILESGDSSKININLNGSSSQTDPNSISINEVEDRYANGQMKSSGMHTISNTEDGQWYYFREDGSLSSMAFYTNGQRNGPYADYYPNGQASLICKFIEGNQSGLSLSFYEDGAKREETEHKNGMKNGKMVQYFQNGKISLNTTFLDDQPNGAYVDFYENGTKKKEGKLSSGTMVGTWKHYFDNGKISLEEARNVEGKLNGAYKGFYANGQQKYISAYVNGVENCATYKEWHENGKIKMEGEVKDGKEFGDWKFYDENGILK
ncbi:MAG: toxin-antitoxin system YwqK family antitoxin [Bacteroidota bacterium]